MNNGTLLSRGTFRSTGRSPGKNRAEPKSSPQVIIGMPATGIRGIQFREEEQGRVEQRAAPVLSHKARRGPPLWGRVLTAQPGSPEGGPSRHTHGPHRLAPLSPNWGRSASQTLLDKSAESRLAASPAGGTSLGIKPLPSRQTLPRKARLRGEGRDLRVRSRGPSRR